jgi:hypothetical protein
VEKVLDKKHRGSTGWESKTWDKTLDFTISDVFIPKNEKVAFVSRVDVMLYAVSGGFVGRAHGELTLNGALKRISIYSSGTTDTTEPGVEITKPENAYYRDNEKKKPLPYPLIFGAIDVEVDASDLESGVNSVEFYVNNELKHTDYNEPYTWYWDESSEGRCYLTAIVYDRAENSKLERKIVYYFND